jgi:hypothetical protein
VLVVAQQLTAFVYDVIERGRRQALSEVLRVCKKARTDEIMRGEMLRYLERSRFADRIDEILESDSAGIGEVNSVVEEIRSYLDAAELRGESARELESYPDQPALRLLRAASEALSSDASDAVVLENVLAALRSGVGKYGIEASLLIDACLGIVDIVSESRPKMAEVILRATMAGAPDRRNAARQIIRRIQITNRNLLNFPLSQLLQLMRSEIQTVQEDSSNG